MILGRYKRINWTNTLFLTLSPIVAIIGTIWWFQAGLFNWNTVLLALVMLYATGLSITAGYHRLFAHKSYEARLPVKIFFLMFGAASFQGSALAWSLDHRAHHQHVDDNDKDPYSINLGFWHAHILWLFFKENSQLSETKGRDLWEDKLVKFQHDYYVAIGAFFCFIFPTLIGLAWGDPIGAFLLAGAARVAFNHQGTFAINSFCHMIGTRPYSDSHSARDSWFTALFTYGEGYHNYHHEFPSDYRNGIRFYHWDPSKWLIYTLSIFGLASNLKRISQELINKKLKAMKQKRLAVKDPFIGTTASPVSPAFSTVAVKEPVA